MNNPTVKRLAWATGVIAPVYLMITVLMPPGFGGVPWMWLVLLVFGASFVSLLIFEKSALWNGLIAFFFWIPMMALHLANPGTETVATGRVYAGLWTILLIGACHSTIQWVARIILNRLRRSGRAQSEHQNIENPLNDTKQAQQNAGAEPPGLL